MRTIHETPSDVAADDGDVHVTGPDGLAYSMTPEAAADTSDRLLHGANHAQGQRNEKKRIADEEKAERSR